MRKGILSEELARLLLESLGYTIEKIRHKVILNGNEVAEVDVIATDPLGEKYGVEVKSGEISISDVRQTYINAKLAKVKPMIIGKGFSNESSARLAQELNVKVLLLPNYVILTPEELYEVVRKSVVEVIAQLFEPPPKLEDEERKLLKELILSSSFNELSQRLGINEKVLGEVFRSLRNKRVLPKTLKGYSLIKVRALIALLLHELLHLS